MKIDGDMSVELRVLCDGKVDLYAAVAAAYLALQVQSWENQKKNPALSALIDKTQVSASGETLVISLDLDEERVPDFLNNLGIFQIAGPSRRKIQ